MYLPVYESPATEPAKPGRTYKYATNKRTFAPVIRPSSSPGGHTLLHSGDLMQMMEDFCHSYEESLSEGNLLLFAKIDPDMPRLSVSDPRLLMRLLHDLSEYSLRQVARGCVVLDLKARQGCDNRYFIYLTITMSGNGIPWDKEKELFRQTGRTERNGSRGASVSNLYFARKIARLYDGDISVRNSLGFGTRFMVNLCLPSMEN